MRAPLDISEFEVERAVLEVRYPQALLLWDRSGRLWSECSKKWPDLKAQHAEPGKTVFRTKDAEFAVELEAARIVAHSPPKPLEPFAEQAEQFMRLVMDALEVTTITRLATRLFFFRRYKTLRDASDALLATELVSLPPGRFFNQGLPPSGPEVALRFEAKATVATLRLRAETRAYDFEPPLGLGTPLLKAIKDERHGLVVDIDFATSASASRSQLLVQEWIEQALHVLRRDLTSFLEAR